MVCMVTGSPKNSCNMVCMVTGSAKSLGKEIILEFAKHRYNVIICYKTHEKEANALARYIVDNYHVGAASIKCDITNENEVKEMMNFISEEIGKVDVLINNAAVELNSHLKNKDLESFHKVLDVNLIGTFLVSKHIKKVMKKGDIINISSNNAINQNDPRTLEYDASKAGIISLTHNLAKEYAPNINVNAIAPGWILTDSIKELDDKLNNEFVKAESKRILKGRFASMNEIASLVYYLTTNDYINDTVITIDGGAK